MAGNKSVVLFLLLLAFLFLLTVPLVLILGYSVGLLQLPQVNYRSIAIAATTGLFVIPVLLIFLAAVIVAVKKRKLAVPSAAVAKVAVARQVPASYAWEGVFGADEESEHKEKRRTVLKPSSANFKAVAAVVIVIALVVLVLLANATKQGSIAGANKTAVANVTAADTPPVTLEEEQNVFSRILAQVFAGRNATNETQAGQDAGEKPAEIKPQRDTTSVSLSAAAKKVLGSAKNFGSKIKSSIIGLTSSIKSRILKVPDAAWRNIAVAAVALLAVGTAFYSHRAGQLGEIPAWFRGWLGWLATILAAARKNWQKVIIRSILVAVVCAAVAAVVFRKWLAARFPSISFPSIMDAAVSALLAVRDFVSAYRLYILIGIFALLAIIGILFMYETRGKKKEKS